MGNAQPPQADDQPEPTPRIRKETARKLAGALTIIAGAIALFNGVTVLAHETTILWLNIDVGLNEFTVCGTLVLIFGAVAIIGGIAAIKGRHLFLSLLGAVLGILGGGVPGFWLGIVSIGLLFLSNEDV